MSELNNGTPNLENENSNVVNNPVNTPEVKQEPVTTQPVGQPTQPKQTAQPTQAAPQTTELFYTTGAKKAVKDMCSWVKIIAVFMLITEILPIILTLLAGIGNGPITTIVSIGVILISLIPISRMFKFCSNAKIGLKQNDPKSMEKAMKAMNGVWSFFAVWILLIVIIGAIVFFAIGINSLSKFGV